MDDRRAEAAIDFLASNEALADFFREELNERPTPRDGDSISIATTATRASRYSAFYSIRPTFSRHSVETVDLDGEPRAFSLSDFCDFIQKHPSLQSAGIVSCSCYTQRSPPLFVLHRFLIMQIEREGRREIWLRLDRLRAPEVGIIDFSLAMGETPSNDRARLAAEESQLLRGSPSQENEMMLNSPYKLGELRSTLLDLVIVMDKYKLTSDNCWAFAALLQDRMCEVTDVSFNMGRLRQSKAAERIRQRLFDMHHNINAEDLSALDNEIMTFDKMGYPPGFRAFLFSNTPYTPSFAVVSPSSPAPVLPDQKVARDWLQQNTRLRLRPLAPIEE